MSPTESDLRASLRDGEGDVPDVDRIMAGGAAARSQRRSRILSTAAAVVIVAGVAVGGVAFASHHGNGDHNADNRRTAAAAAGGGGAPAGGTAAGANAPGTARSSAAGAPVVPAPADAKASLAPGQCPASFPHTVLPGGGSPGQFGASGSLFTKPVASIVVCTYAATSSPARTVLNGAAARSLASSLDNASKTPFRGMCPDYIRADAPSLAIIATATDGSALPAVTTSLGRPACATQISNGTVVRYDWSPPASLNSVLGTAATTTPGGAVPTH
jgi:hypothetical protein